MHTTHPLSMSEGPVSENLPWIAIAISSIAGMVGGCAVGSLNVLAGRQLSVAIMLAYGILGFALGGMSFLVMLSFFPDTTLERTVLAACVIGALGTVLLTAIKYGTNVTLRWRNMEVGVTLRRINDRRSSDCTEED